MGRRPVYGLHKATGQARTTFNGKRVYLGPHGSPESLHKFDEILARWEAARAEQKSPAALKLSVSRLSVLFLAHAETEYSKNGKTTRSTTTSGKPCGPRRVKILRRPLNAGASCTSEL